MMRVSFRKVKKFLRSSFSFKTGKVVIDWGSSALKILSAQKLREGYLINQFLHYPFQEKEDQSKILSSIWTEKNLSSSESILCLDGPSTLIRVIDFPRMDKRLIRESLGYELSRHTPFSQEEVYFDFSVIDINKAPSFKLILALARKDFVDERLSLMREAGLWPVKVTLGPISLANAYINFYPLQDSQEPVGILDLEFGHTIIDIIYNHNLSLSREIEKGSRDVLLRLSNILGTEIGDFADIAGYLNKLDFQALSEVMSDLVEEVKLSLDYLETKENLGVKKIYLTGGLASLKDLEGVFSLSLGIEVLPLEILKFFSCESSIKEKLEEREKNFAVAIGSLL